MVHRGPVQVEGYKTSTGQPAIAIREFTVLAGPNTWSNQPVVHLQVDRGAATELMNLAPASSCPTFVPRLPHRRPETRERRRSTLDKSSARPHL